MTLHRLLNCGTFLTNCVGMVVSDKPVVFAKEEVRYGYLNGTVDLVCQVQAEPPPTFKWSKILKSGKARDFKGKVENDSEEMHRSVAKVRLLLNITCKKLVLGASM